MGSGATSILSFIFMNLQEGDEVLVVQSYFPWYTVQPQFFKGTLKFVNMELKEDEFSLDWNKVAQQITSKTRYILINSPHNPTGKVFKKEDFAQLELLMEKHPHLIVLSDEVYEMVSFVG